MARQIDGIRRMLLIINKIYATNGQYGDSCVSVQELLSYINDHVDAPISERTLQRDINDIEMLFHIEISFDRATNSYRINERFSRRECQTLQEERERNNAIFAAALLGALGTTVSNITGSSNQSSGAAYSGGGGAASSASTAAAGSSASTKTATRCTACNGKGVCQSCKNHPGKATSNSKDRTPCKVCGGKITCQYCGGSGFKKL